MNANDIARLQGFEACRRDLNIRATSTSSEFFRLEAERLAVQREKIREFQEEARRREAAFWEQIKREEAKAREKMEAEEELSRKKLCEDWSNFERKLIVWVGTKLEDIERNREEALKRVQTLEREKERWEAERVDWVRERNKLRAEAAEIEMLRGKNEELRREVEGERVDAQELREMLEEIVAREDRRKQWEEEERRKSGLLENKLKKITGSRS
jgi:hypothetical protein